MATNHLSWTVIHTVIVRVPGSLRAVRLRQERKPEDDITIPTAMPSHLESLVTFVSDLLSRAQVRGAVFLNLRIRRWKGVPILRLPT